MSKRKECKTVDHAVIEPILTSEFDALFKANHYAIELKKGYFPLEYFAQRYGLTSEHVRHQLKNHPNVERKKFKLPHMSYPKYFYKIKK